MGCPSSQGFIAHITWKHLYQVNVKCIRKIIVKYVFRNANALIGNMKRPRKCGFLFLGADMSVSVFKDDPRTDSMQTILILWPEPPIDEDCPHFRRRFLLPFRTLVRRTDSAMMMHVHLRSTETFHVNMTVDSELGVFYDMCGSGIPQRSLKKKHLQN